MSTRGDPTPATQAETCKPRHSQSRRDPRPHRYPACVPEVLLRIHRGNLLAVERAIAKHRHILAPFASAKSATSKQIIGAPSRAQPTPRDPPLKARPERPTVGRSARFRRFASTVIEAIPPSPRTQRERPPADGAALSHRAGLHLQWCRAQRARGMRLPRPADFGQLPDPALSALIRLQAATARTTQGACGRPQAATLLDRHMVRHAPHPGNRARVTHRP